MTLAARSTWAIPLLAVALLAPLFILGANGLDSGAYNYTWTRQFAAALRHGELYPRWLPDSFMGLGSPAFYFYPPLAIYVSSLFDLAGLPTWQAINAAALVALMASGLAMWLWLRDRTPRALLWACLYMAAPYHLNDIYLRAALAEFAAYAWLPLVAMGVEGRPRLLAISFAGLILTHLPTAVLCSVFLIPPMLATRPRRELAATALAGAIGLALAAIYLGPALALQRYVSIDQLSTAGMQPSRITVWAGAVPPHHLAIMAALAALSGAAFRTAGRSRRPRLWAGVGLVSTAMAAGLVPTFWALPILRQVQFPFRALSIAEFATITALALATPPRGLLRIGVGLAVFAWAMTLAFAAILVPAANAPRLLSRIERTMQDAPEYMPPGTAPRGLTLFDRLPRAERFLPADRFNFPIWRVDGRAFNGPVIPRGHVVTRQRLGVERVGAAVSLGASLIWLGWILAAARRRSAPTRP